MELTLASKCAFGIFYILTGLGGLIGNFLVIFAIVSKRPHRDRQANIHLLTLAMADFLTSLIVVPYFMLGLNLPKFEPSHKEKYNLPCRFGVFFVYLCGGQRILSLTVMSTDRYIAILHPFFYGRYFQRNTALTVNIYVVFQTVVTNLPILLVPGWAGYDGKPGSPCGFIWKGKLEFLIVYFLVNFVVPLILLIVSNICVFRTARKQRKRIMKESCQRADLWLDCSCTGEITANAPSRPMRESKQLQPGSKVLKSPPRHIRAKALVFPTPSRELTDLESTPEAVTYDKQLHSCIEVNNLPKDTPESLGIGSCVRNSSGGTLAPEKALKNSTETMLSRNDDASDRIETVKGFSNGSMLSVAPDKSTENLTASHKTKRTKQGIFQDLTIAFSTLILVLVFIVSWFPFAASRTAFIINRKLFSWTVVAITSSLTLVSAVCNPFIVIGTRKDLRKRIKDKIWAPCGQVCHSRTT